MNRSDMQGNMMDTHGVLESQAQMHQQMAVPPSALSPLLPPGSNMGTGVGLPTGKRHTSVEPSLNTNAGKASVPNNALIPNGMNNGRVYRRQSQDLQN